ncbi:unnamed protein product [marine sediment metagenome]|uniref:Uncharacterized protein n=1 Tax=marine sediment metagenome TaxID=412755 RepID=X1AJB0_9ZZZZ
MPLKLSFMGKEELKRAMGDLDGYEILDSLPLPEDFETLDLDELEIIAKAKREESR